MDGLELISDCTSFRSGMMQPRVPESESTVLRISNSGGVCRGGVGQVQRKETAEQGSKKEFPNFGNVQNLEILFCCRHYTRDVNQFVGGRFDRLGDQS